MTTIEKRTSAILARIEEIKQLGSGMAYEVYGGPYEVEPLRTAQILATRSMAMRDDVNVHGVSFSNIKNSAGGTTCNIGGAN